MRRRAAFAAVVWVTSVVCLAFALSACAVPEGSEARPVDSDIAELLTPEVTPTPDVTEAPPQQPIHVTWVRGQRLVQVLRLEPVRTRQQKLDVAFNELRIGPRPTEQRRNLISLLPPDLIFEGDVRGERTVINLNGNLETPQSGVTLAVGQLATTALAVPGVRNVVFTIDGDRIRVPVPGGGKLKGVVEMRDYRRILS
ncbi:MAG TPA: GerMN domain-containing protein [Actinomycetes bacterium]|nr:GerMN domain-containing protein [Actinomycetes bacterium]